MPEINIVTDSTEKQGIVTTTITGTLTVTCTAEIVTLTGIAYTLSMDAITTGSLDITSPSLVAPPVSVVMDVIVLDDVFVSEEIFLPFVYPYDVAGPYEGLSLFSVAQTSGTAFFPSGSVSHSADSLLTGLDLSGVSIDYTAGGISTNAHGCSLIGSGTSTKYAVGKTMAVGGVVTFLDRDNAEIQRTISNVTWTTDSKLQVIEFDQTVSQDNCAIYQVLENAEDLSNKPLLFITHLRDLRVRMCNRVEAEILYHRTVGNDRTDLDWTKQWVPGNPWAGVELEADDGGKPVILVYRGKPIIAAIAETDTTTALNISHYAAEIDAITTTLKTTCEAPKIWPYDAAAGFSYYRHITDTVTWETYFTSYDRELLGLASMPTPREMADIYGTHWMHNPGGQQFPMSFIQFDNATATAVANPTQENLNRADWDAFVTWGSWFSERYRLAIYPGGPTPIVPLDGETVAEWVAHAKLMLKPALDIRPRALIGVDAVWGQTTSYFSANFPNWVWQVLGGNNGGIATLFNELADEGYEVLKEPWANDVPESAWAADFGESIVNYTRLSRESESEPEWSSHNPRIENVSNLYRKGRRLIYLQSRDIYYHSTPGRRQALIDETLKSGHDVIVRRGGMPNSDSPYAATDYDVVTNLHDQFIFNQSGGTDDPATGAVPEVSAGELQWADTSSGMVRGMDWSGIAIAASDPAAIHTLRSSRPCCTLLGPADMTWFGFTNWHQMPKIGETVYFLNYLNKEVSRTVVDRFKATPDNGSNTLAAIQFDAPMVSAVDLCRIYPIAESWYPAVGETIVCIEQDRRCTNKLIDPVPYTTPHMINHSEITPGDNLEDGDSAKPGFVVANGELVCLIPGHVGINGSAGVTYYADAMDALTEAIYPGQSFRRVTLP